MKTDIRYRSEEITGESRTRNMDDKDKRLEIRLHKNQNICSLKDTLLVDVGKITEYRRIMTLTTETWFSDLWRLDYQDHGLARLLFYGTFLFDLQFVFFMD